MRARLKKGVVVSQRLVRWLVTAAIVAGILLVGWLMWQVLDLSVHQRSNATTITQQQAEIDGAQETNARQDEALELANQKLVKAGQTPVQVPSLPQSIPGATGPAGQQGRPGPSAYDLWLAAGNRGTLGQFLFSLKGATGDEGDPGPAGTNGTDGKDSTVAGPPGAQGPAGPAGPAGADGEAGAAGPQGEPGRGIQSLMCGSDGRWTVTYTDGTSADAGSCRVGLLD